MITIYSTASCMKCKMLKNECDKKGIVYESVDIEKNQDAYTMLESAGILSLPVVGKDGALNTGDNKSLMKIIES